MAPVCWYDLLIMFRRLLLVLSIFTMGGVQAAGPDEALRLRYDELRPMLLDNVFDLPLVLESSERDGRFGGNAYGVVEHRFEDVAQSLDSTEEWCEILFLHPNAKSCVPLGDRGLRLYMGREIFQPPDEVTRIDSHLQLRAREAGYLEVAISAEEGPLGMGEFIIELAAVPLDEQSTFVHFGYSARSSVMADLAMGFYFMTLGFSKVGFSRDADGALVRGRRGLMERSVMRYYLALGAFLEHPLESEQRRAAWFDAIERYPRQLHELEREEYLQQKRLEHLEQRRLLQANAER